MLIETERPAVLSEVIGRDKEVAQIRAMLANKEGIPHILLSGKQGTGKTTIAHAIANELFCNPKQITVLTIADVLDNGLRKQNFFEFNASSTRGIEFIRGDISEIAKRRPMSGAGYKIILMDEADNVTQDAQMCLRRIMELNHKTTRFILTANYPYRLIPQLISRCVQIPFDSIDTVVIAKHLKRISIKHGLKFTDSQLMNFAKIANGDMRLAINNLEGNVESESSHIFDGLTLDKIRKMAVSERISLAFKADPDFIFGKLWEIVQREEAWDKLTTMADCNYKMNASVHKTLFLANLLEKF